MKAPFPYFGGKSMIAPIVWKVLGDCGHYIEPFFGSGAVLLSRPNFNSVNHTETVCDADGYLANAWRGIQFAPDAVAKWCDWPVNHADLIARKARLIREKNYLLENLCKDDKWHDAELAGYWMWAAGCWIGSGMTRPGQIPHLGNTGMGVHAKGQRPHLSCAGKGVHAKGKRPHLSDAVRSLADPYNPNIYTWFRQLSERLRHVRVVCGDWSRICGGDWQDANWKTVGVFFDPPYGVQDRDLVYDADCTEVAAKVRTWALERGNRENYRIVYAGYDTEGEALEAAGWTAKKWKTGQGYAKTARNGKQTQGKDNARRECLWFSPHCGYSRHAQATLF
jgi:DNA adenine methylase